MRLGIGSKAIKCIMLGKCTMILYGANTVEEYGKILRWDSHSKALDLFIGHLEFSPPEGFLILEAQDKLMKFLVDCCQGILRDIDPGMLTSNKYPIQPEPRLKSELELRGFESLASMAAEAPYRRPARFELRRVESLLAAKTRALEDHIWALREDPVYCRQNLLDAKEILLEKENNRHGFDPTLTPGSERLLSEAHFVSNVLFDAYFELDVFSKLYQQARELAVLQKKYESVISPTKELPDEFLLAISKFLLLMAQGSGGNLNQLKLVAMESPQIRKFYTCSSDDNLPVPRGIEMSKVEAKCTYLLQTLWENRYDLSCMGFPLIVDELERLLLSEPTAGELISGKVASIFDSLSILTWCNEEINFYQPWAKNFNYITLVARKDLEAASDIKGVMWLRTMAAFKPENLSKILPFAEPLLGSFTYPYDKHRTKANVECMRRAEQNLDKFWAQVDDLILSASGDAKPALALQRLLSQPHLLQRTPEWTDQQTPIHTVEKPLSPLFFKLWGCQIHEQTIAHAQTMPVQAKVKDNEKADPQPSEAIQSGHIETEETIPKPSFSVDNRALKVFRTLFFNPAITSSPGEIAWNDFLHAMKSVGLSAQKLYGSVWQFSLAQTDGYASVQFCEPRCKSKIPFMVARRQGRTLTRAYGWTGSMFVLKK
ncbi:hypothetical protein TrVFT333_003406 [Trichoderma virens FT-333]|nr:hypothetical protein TrVFT333_003406 [Trichoderma virens FT-333]